MSTPAPIPVLAVDGPSGTGKGTLCQRLASALGWHLLDSGALYRCVGHAARRHMVDLTNAPALEQVARSLNVSFIAAGHEDGQYQVLCADEDVTTHIRSEQSAHAASVVAALPDVRAALLQRQRDFRQRPGLVADGRDMGTVVFPDAVLKIFLTASAEQRAQRRYQQLKDQGFDANLARLIKDIAERDQRDMARSVAPLRPAADAVILDTSNLTREAVFDRVMDMLSESGLVVA